MATIVLQAAGAFLGGFLGPVGTALGAAAGSLAGYVIDRALIDGTQHTEGPRLTGPRPFGAEDGASLPRVYGTVRVGGTLIWATRFEEQQTETRQGSKGGAKTTEYSYYANVAFALAEANVAHIRRVWADGQEIDRTLFDMRFHGGGEGQGVDPLIDVKQGADNAPAYRGTAYVVFERFPLGDFGNRIPQFHFEIIRPTGAVASSLKAVALIPGATEFGLSPSAVTQELEPGVTESLNRHILYADSDIAASLDELQALCPALEHVGLVVAWFGNDLRAASCSIRPAVVDNGGSGFSQNWTVSGITRDAAPAVSYHAGNAAYGGSPSDKSVLDAIAEIKARGLGVTLYPFVMMDIPAGNALPDPYGGSEQAAFPWRGHITCHPASAQPGTADKTASARTQINAFCGAATAGDYAASAETILFEGDPDDWGYRRMVLHYAHLAVAAGGVDAFLIGSELRGLTTLRDGTGAFPFVEQLCDIAGDVRAICGVDTKITYGADWSEYFGHQPADGSGDVLFHLDALWAHAAIDAVGIDNYMPLSDWRDSDYDGASPDGFAGPYDPAGLRASIKSGEGFAWHYASEADRSARVRTEIADGAYGKPWVYRYKDLAAWWQNQHFDRHAGIESGVATAWVPEAKPIWFTELGCPAVDKGPNQPNVFPDPKSAESNTPHFSNGARSDIAPLRFLEAHLRHWDPAGIDFTDGNNPVSSVYGGRMVDATRVYAWSWDARPFPAFPQMSNLWSDGTNWLTGHWLNGRLSGVAVDDLIQAVLGDHGLAAASTTNADGFMHGYIVPDPVSARAALQPVIDLYGLQAAASADGLAFSCEGVGRSSVLLTDLAMEDDRATVEIVRSPDGDLPSEAILAFRDVFNVFESASARQSALGAQTVRQETISFAGVLEQSEAEALLGGWLRRRWMQRERISFSTPVNDTALEAGAIVRLPDHAPDVDFLVDEVELGLVRRTSARQILRGVGFGGVPRDFIDSAPRPVEYGRPHVHFLDLPMGIGASSEPDQFRVAAWTRPWKSQAVFASPETTGFVRRTTIERPAVLGTLVEPLAESCSGRIDYGTAVTVRLSAGELASVSSLQLLNGGNTAALSGDGSSWEIIQFMSAEEVEPSIWRLTGLLRGQLGTEDAAAAGASAGSAFVLLDEGAKAAGLAAAETGLALNWKVGPAGFDFASGKFHETNLIGGLRARLPLSPVHLRAARDEDGLHVTWIRRGRIEADSWNGDDIPLGEESELYRIEVSAEGGEQIRIATAATPAWLYPAVDIAVDFPIRPVDIIVSVRQIGATVGGGMGAVLSMSLL